MKVSKIRQRAHELRAILADISTVRFEKPRSDRPAAIRLAHMALVTTIYKVSHLAAINYEKKIPQWPFQAKDITVLSYGREKIVYKVTPEDQQAGDRVVSVYHLESMGKEPLEVIRKKQKNYETYRKYFGRLIVPTSFAVLDNPWGEGTKPASIQPFIENTDRFSNYSVAQLEARAAADAQFAENLRLLKNGYYSMLADGIGPDFGGGNLVVSGSDIMILDTGLVPTADRIEKIKRLVPGYAPDYALVGSIHILEIAK